MQNLKKCKGVSLLELIISILILSITISSFSFLLQTFLFSSKLVNQENLFFSQFNFLALISKKYFDENNSLKKDKVLKAIYGDSELLADNKSRLGKIEINNNSLRSGSSYSVSKIGLDEENIKDDVDDFEGFSMGNFKVNVFYIDDEANYSFKEVNFTLKFLKKSLTNIKLIKIRDLDKNISLVYMKCNIGNSKMLSLEDIK